MGKEISWSFGGSFYNLDGDEITLSVYQFKYSDTTFINLDSGWAVSKLHSIIEKTPAPYFRDTNKLSTVEIFWIAAFAGFILGVFLTRKIWRS